jgi:hypothetical protein
MWQPIAAVATGVVGLGAYWFKSLCELKLKYDAALRLARLTRYEVLWEALEPLASTADRDRRCSRGLRF